MLVLPRQVQALQPSKETVSSREFLPLNKNARKFFRLACYFFSQSALNDPSLDSYLNPRQEFSGGVAPHVAGHQP